MRTRALKTTVPLLVTAFVFAVSGCNVLAKLKKKKAPDPEPDITGPTTTVQAKEIDAFNKADVKRFPDETRIVDESAFIRVITFARTSPDADGISVGVIDANTIVIKHARHLGNTLVSFDRQAFPGRRFLGWVADSAFEEAAATEPESTTPAVAGTATGAVKPKTTATPAASIVAAPATAAPATGTCKMTLRTTNFKPSKSTCSFDEKVRAGSPATLTFPCEGGRASARFSSQTFNGSASKDRVTISTSTQTTFSGCQVRTTQTITGRPPNLSYFLSERIVGGSCKSVSTCTARATIVATQ